MDISNGTIVKFLNNSNIFPTITVDCDSMFCVPIMLSISSVEEVYLLYRIICFPIKFYTT